MHILLMTVLSFALCFLSTLGDAPIFSFALYLGGLFMGHALTTALNES